MSIYIKALTLSTFIAWAMWSALASDNVEQAAQDKQLDRITQCEEC